MGNANLPKTRTEARSLGIEYYFTGTPCIRGHIAPRKIKGACTECLKLEWQKAADSRKEYFENYNRRESVKDKKHSWYLINREKVIQAAAIRPKAVLKQYRDAWKQRNVLKVRADTKARRRKHRQATPPWLTRTQKTEIRQIYQIAITTTKLTGVQYVVDHIIPLRSDIVCGLHVPWNLQVITQEDNLIKSNRHGSV